MAAPKKGGLGRGLDALFADVPVKAPKETEVIKNREDGDEKDTVRYVKIHDIMPNANQPRKTFNEEKIEELASSCGLSAREKDIALLIYKGKTNDEIGEILFLSTNTIKVHTSNLYKKMGVSNRVSAVQKIRGEE